MSLSLSDISPLQFVKGSEFNSNRNTIWIMLRKYVYVSLTKKNKNSTLLSVYKSGTN